MLEMKYNNNNIFVSIFWRNWSILEILFGMRIQIDQAMFVIIIIIFFRWDFKSDPNKLFIFFVIFELILLINYLF